MRYTCFELMKTGELAPVDVAVTTERWRADDGAFWIDVDSYQTEDMEKWLDGFKLRPFIKRRCLEIGKATQLSLFPDCAHLEINVFSGEE